MDSFNTKQKYFSEGQRVYWQFSPYNEGFGIIRGKVEGIPDLDDDWWIVELEDPEGCKADQIISFYPYSCIVVPAYRLELV